MMLRRSMTYCALMSAACWAPPLRAQTSFVAPDGKNRFPAVTIFCPSGTGVAPCSFGGGGTGASGAVSINLGGTAVSSSNRFPVGDAALDALINGGALNVGGSVAVNALPPVGLAAGTNAIGSVSVSNLPVSQVITGTVGISALPPLPSGANAIGNVSISNLPAIQPISAATLPLPSGAALDSSVQAVRAVMGSPMQQSGGTITVSGLPALPAGNNAIGSVSVSNLPATQAVAGTVAISGTATVAGTVGVSALPALPAGANTIGAVTISGTPNFNCTGCSGGGGGAVTQGAGAASNPWWMQGLGTAGTAAGGVVSVQGVGGGVALPVSGTFWQAVQPVSGTVSVASLPNGSNAIGSVSVSNLPATQAISAASLPLPAGAALDASVQAVKTTLGTPMQQTGGSVAIASLPALPTGTNAIGSVTISNLPATQAVSGSVAISGTATVAGTVGISALPALPAGANTIGAVTISGTPTFTCTGCSGGGGGGAVTQGAGAAGNPWWMQGLGTAGTAAGGVVSVQGVGGGVALPVSGTFWQALQPVSGTVSVTSLPSGSNAIGSVSVSNLPATQAISAASLPLPAGAALDASEQAIKTTLGTPMQQTGGSVAIASLPALPAGTNAIGNVSVSNLPATQAISAASLPLPAGAALDASLQAVKTTLGTPMQQSGGSVSVSNLPTTQPVSVAALPLPTGAATAAAQVAPLAPVAPGAATATSTVLMGCLANTALPSFTAGQQGAIPCDTSGRPYVVSVPSANNVPSYLQAVTSGGATVYRAINAASSTMAASIKSASGMIYGYEACNSGTAAAYLRLFALGVAPTVGTSTPLVSKLLPVGGCQTMTTSIGLVFGSGIGVDVTSGSMADGDTTAVAAAATVSVSVYYK